MLHVQIIQVGKTKEKYIKDALGEYLKRLKNRIKLEIITLKDQTGDRGKIIEKEGRLIMKKIPESSYLIALDTKGEEKSSEKFAELIKKMKQKGKVTFIIGGAYGLSPDIIERADLTLSLSKMTFTHQMVRVVLLEQIYRAFTILEGGSYHH